ncbi:MAG: DUF2092 domain-containing protein [Chthoniobacterales bacterium]
MNRRLTCLLALLCLSARLAWAQDDTSAAEAVLRQMAAKYAALKSYSDTTTVHFRNPDGAAGASAECKIWFERPVWFRIDGQSRRAPDAPSKREVLWCDGKTARSWSTASAVTTLNRIQLAGSKMFGTYAYHIPTLLQEAYAGPRRLNQLETPTLANNETVDGVECLHVRGTWSGDSYEVWLGKGDFIVRKITAIYSGYGMEELHHEIVIDQSIPMKIFQFEPEKEAAPPAKK